MKKMLLVLVAVVFLAGVSWGQEGFKPFGAVSFELGGSIIAPIGVGLEFFLGHLGLGVELRFLFLGSGGVLAGTLDPGAAVRYYFADLDSSFYVMGGVSYVTAFAIAGGGGGTAPIGILKPKAGFGYQALFGKNNRIRFAAELGADYMLPIVRGDVFNVSSVFFILPHALVMFGYTF